MKKFLVLGLLSLSAQAFGQIRARSIPDRSLRPRFSFDELYLSFYEHPSGLNR